MHPLIGKLLSYSPEEYVFICLNFYVLNLRYDTSMFAFRLLIGAILLSKCSSSTPKGLINRGNTCYLNSLIQGLFSLESFRNLVTGSDPEKDGNMVNALSNIFQILEKKKELSAPDDVITLLRNDGFAVNRQQDTPDAYMKIRCLSSRNEPFVMPVISYGLISTATIGALPGVISLEIGFRIAQTNFPLNVDPTKNLIVFYSRNLPSRGGKSRVSVEVPEFLCAKYPFPKSSEDVFYELKAVGIHFGSVNSGHYVAYGKHDGTWWKFNDSSVSSVSFNDVKGTSEHVVAFYFELQDQPVSVNEPIEV
eukprot:GHVR01141813.1.p1 GENE.GHVR01141813.1~~GHVR01141813.1.p1  ORF type:complete len:307 (-),score=10.68 GHVR01141813.1:107-1027(-)